jgi:hypothetical protein
MNQVQPGVASMTSDYEIFTSESTLNLEDFSALDSILEALQDLLYMREVSEFGTNHHSSRSQA